MPPDSWASTITRVVAIRTLEWIARRPIRLPLLAGSLLLAGAAVGAVIAPATRRPVVTLAPCAPMYAAAPTAPACPPVDSSAERPVLAITSDGRPLLAYWDGRAWRDPRNPLVVIPTITAWRPLGVTNTP